jgi:hypothetical protein
MASISIDSHTFSPRPDRQVRRHVADRQIPDGGLNGWRIALSLPETAPRPAFRNRPVNNADSPDLFRRSGTIKSPSPNPVKARQAPMRDIDGRRKRHCVNRA